MNKFILLAFLFTLFNSCEKNSVLPATDYACSFQGNLPTIDHPKASTFQDILQNWRKANIAGGVALIKNQEGFWIGADGYADIQSEVPLQICNSFLIASITKLITATAVMQLVEVGTIQLDANINTYLSPDLLKDLSNAEVATVRQLLQHTSGIPDFYDNTAFELTRMNKENNRFKPIEILDYARKLDAYFPVGSDYEYSNTNYLLLGLILEAVKGIPLGQVYQSQIFEPLGMASAYFNIENPFPPSLVKGYGEPFQGTLIESDWLYVDEMGTADGGIAINAYDLFLFAEGLFNGQLLEEETLAEMLNPITLTEDDSETIIGHQRNGLGIEIYDTPYGGEAYGHTGGIDGFLSYLAYFPADSSVFIYLQNTASYNNEARINLINEMTQAMQD